MCSSSDGLARVFERRGVSKTLLLLGVDCCEGAFPLPGSRASVPAVVVPEVASRRLPVGAPMEPRAWAAW